MDPLYILIMAIATILTAAFTVLRMYSMRKQGNPGDGGQFRSRVKSLEDAMPMKRDIPFCDERYANILKDLTEGQAQFKTILEIQAKQADMISRIDERVDFLAEKNGFGKIRR